MLFTGHCTIVNKGIADAFQDAPRLFQRQAQVTHLNAGIPKILHHIFLDGEATFWRNATEGDDFSPNYYARKREKGERRAAFKHEWKTSCQRVHEDWIVSAAGLLQIFKNPKLIIVLSYSFHCITVLRHKELNVLFVCITVSFLGHGCSASIHQRALPLVLAHLRRISRCSSKRCLLECTGAICMRVSYTVDMHSPGLQITSW